MKNFLDEQVQRINTPSFIETDPVQFPRRYERLQDIEIVSFAVSAITWGKREMILRNADRMLAKMGDSPYDFVMNEDFRALGKANIHRTFFEPDLIYLLRGFHKIFSENGSVEVFLQKQNAQNAWDIARLLQTEMASANNGKTNSKCLPANFEKSALKRLNLALRWLVRNDGIVDLGVWNILKPSQLYIPLDVHVGNIARQLGILQRKQNDRQAVEELTAVLRAFCPNDPVKYDYALFGIGIGERKIFKQK
ncbi:MAG: TIGR02757 family protein [Dysgonamonadaceae bacterium]|nr:TIGR02757 family protein [Dysgonamonadaceae bacterium]